MASQGRCMLRSFSYYRFLFAVTVCLAGTPSGAEEEPPVDLGALEAGLERAYEENNYDRALEIAEQMAEYIWPKHVEALYNVARIHNLRGDKIKAYEWLQYAVDSGYWDVQRMREDETFENLREEKKFRSLSREAWANGYIWMLERDERENFQKPERVMETLAFRPGERVADVGAGSGYFAVRVAKAVGSTGKVWAVDISQEMLDYLRQRLEAEQLENVELRLVKRDDPELPEGEVDTILLVDTWHYIRDPEYAKKLRGGLAPGGRIVIIDYRPKPWEERPWGPPPEQQTSREELDAHFAEAGLVPVRAHDFLPEQYFVEYVAE